jgi:hypothetical protein
VVAAHAGCDGAGSCQLRRRPNAPDRNRHDTGIDLEHRIAVRHDDDHDQGYDHCDANDEHCRTHEEHRLTHEEHCRGW